MGPVETFLNLIRGEMRMRSREQAHFFFICPPVWSRNLARFDILGPS